MRRYLEGGGGGFVGIGERVRMFDNIRQEFRAEGVFERVLSDGFVQLRAEDGSTVEYMAAISSMKFL